MKNINTVEGEELENLSAQLENVQNKINGDDCNDCKWSINGMDTKGLEMLKNIANKGESEIYVNCDAIRVITFFNVEDRKTKEKLEMVELIIEGCLQALEIPKSLVSDFIADLNKESITIGV